MEYVAGGSLADRLEASAVTPREAARLMETLARAIQEVHRLGIVHRDLKPANVLLTEDGVPKIADFGLAKWMDVDSGLTRTGFLLGSPSYMAPEQAGGTGSLVGPAADVYSLGAILYELLTGRPPFRAATLLETLHQVRSEEPIDPSRLRPKLPRDLVTICLKCLQKEPARRYHGAETLAEDLRRFQAGEPIFARPVGSFERLWRWCRREPAVAALAAGLFAGLVGVASQWWRAEAHLDEAIRQRGVAEMNIRLQTKVSRDLRVANEREATARRRAQERFDAAMRALERFETLTKDAELQRAPHLDPVRAKLLRTALGFYRELQESLEDDASPGARTQLSKAYSRIADISWELGLSDEALATHRRALALIEQMRVAKPDAPDLRAALARGHARIGFTLRTVGRLGESMHAYERARDIQEILARDDPSGPGHRQALSWTLSNLGLIHHDLGRAAEAIPLHQRAISIHEGLVDREPDNTHLVSDLAWARRYLGQALAAAGDPDGALPLLHRAIESLNALIEAGADDQEIHWRLARCRDEVGSIFLRNGRQAEAGEPLDQAADVHEKLARDNPSLYRVDLVRSCLYVASYRAATGRLDDALANVERAEELIKQLPTVLPATLYDLACAHSLSSALGSDGASPDRMEARGERAMAALRRALAAGYADVSKIKRDPLLNPLRTRHDFQALIATLSPDLEPSRR